MNFDHYKAEDFLQDDTFVNFCLQRNASDVAFWKAYVSEHPYKQREVEEAVELYFVLNGNLSREQYLIDQQSFESELSRYKRTLNRREKASSSTRTVALRWLVGAAAAAVLGFVFVITDPFGYRVAKPAPAYVENSKRGERRSFQLPDGSSVMLNSGSTLKLADGFNSDAREVVLDGEAFFEVTHMPSKPFIIKTKYLGVRVLGTVFNVKAYGQDRFGEATLLEGSVEVTLLRENNRKVILKPQEKITYSEDGSPESQPSLVSKPADKSAASGSELSWTKNRLAFRDATFGEIAHTLERWFDVNITFVDKEVGEYRFTATFEKQTVDEVFEALRLSRHFEYSRSGNNIQVEK